METDQVTPFDELPKHVKCGIYYASGYTRQEAAQRCGYARHPSDAARDLLDAIDEGDPADVIEDELGVNIEVCNIDEVRRALHKMRQQQAQLEWQLNLAEMGRKVLRAKYGAARDEDK